MIFDVKSNATQKDVKILSSPTSSSVAVDWGAPSGFSHLFETRMSHTV